MERTWRRAMEPETSRWFNYRLSITQRATILCITSVHLHLKDGHAILSARHAANRCRQWNQYGCRSLLLRALNFCITINKSLGRCWDCTLKKVLIKWEGSLYGLSLTIWQYNQMKNSWCPCCSAVHQIDSTVIAGISETCPARFCLDDALCHLNGHTRLLSSFCLKRISLQHIQ